MSRPIKSSRILIVLLIASLLFSENTGKAFLYSCCLLNNFDFLFGDYDLFGNIHKRKSFLLKRSWLFVSIISVIFDIYHSLFIGISLVSLSVVIIVAKKFESVLMNLPVWVRLYYSLMIILGAESVNFLITALIGGKFNIHAHVMIVAKSIFFCYAIESLKEHVKR